MTTRTGWSVTSRSRPSIIAAPFQLPPGSIRTTPSGVTTTPKLALLPRFSAERSPLGPMMA
jgi:hypothetical protein